MHKISIKRLKIFAYHGLYKTERENGQIFCVSLDYVPEKKDSLNDNINNTTDYMDIISALKLLFVEKKYKLMEELSEYLCIELMKKYSLIYVNITIEKSAKFLNEDLEKVKVNFEIKNA